VLPNVHFHCTTTYDILRHNGVELGKMDYLGASRRPEAALHLPEPAALEVGEGRRDLAFAVHDEGP
jgi:hypothetical protein